MKPLDFQPIKDKETFQRNYQLHDAAIKIAKPKLLKLGFKFKKFGEDKRNELVWEKGEDKPDCFLIYDEKIIGLIDWKGKTKKTYWMNKRAYDSYLKWGQQYNLPIFLIIVIVPTQDIKVVQIPSNNIEIDRAWNGNLVVKFNENNLMTLKDFEKKLKV